VIANPGEHEGDRPAAPCLLDREDPAPVGVRQRRSGVGRAAGHHHPSVVEAKGPRLEREGDVAQVQLRVRFKMLGQACRRAFERGRRLRREEQKFMRPGRRRDGLRRRRLRHHMGVRAARPE
jgi:hypothetical protein